MPSSTDRRRYDVACPIACALDTVGERWTLLILRELLPGALRFSEIKGAIRGINATILSRRLEQMREEGLLQLVELRNLATAYAATPKAEALWPILVALAAWGSSQPEADGTEGLTPAAAATAFVALRPPDAPRQAIGFTLEGARLEWQPDRKIPLARVAGQAGLEIAASPLTLFQLVTGRLSAATAQAKGQLTLSGAAPGLFLDHLPRA